MRARIRDEQGFLVIELTIAVFVIAVALLALMASYDQGLFSIHSSAKTSAAADLAERQLELYASLPFASVGLDSSALTDAQANDSTYADDEAALPGSGDDVAIPSCGSSPQCSPVQTLTGSDNHSYKLETFIRSVTNITNPDGSSQPTWDESVVTVIVRDLSVSSSPKVATLQTAFDPGPPTLP